jgi:hypothetical protein
MLFDTLHNNNTLTSLNLSNNVDIGGSEQVGTEDNEAKEETSAEKLLAKSLWRMLIHNGTLTSLNLANTGLGDEAVRKLCNAFRNDSEESNGGEACHQAEMFPFPALRRLDISRNPLVTHRCATSLYHMLRHNSTLHSLNLSGALIGDEGAALIAEALRQNSTLQSIDLSASNVGPHGAEQLAGMLCTNATLNWLGLANNRIGIGAVSALGKALALNSSLIYLNLSGNRIGVEGLRRLAQGLRYNGALSTLLLERNAFGIEGRPIIASITKNHPLLMVHASDYQQRERGGDGSLQTEVYQQAMPRSFSLRYPV